MSLGERAILDISSRYGWGKKGVSKIIRPNADLRADVEILAINDLGNVESNIHLYKYDSVHGKCKEEINNNSGTVKINNQEIVSKIVNLVEKKVIELENNK